MAAVGKRARGEGDGRTLEHGARATTGPLAHGAHSQVSLRTHLPGDWRSARSIVQHGQEISGSGSGSLPQPHGTMGNKSKTPSDDQIRAAIAQQAGEWFIGNQEGPLAAEDSAAFFAWLTASPVHVREYLGVARVARYFA